MIRVDVRAASEKDYPEVTRIQESCPAAAQWPLGDYSNYNVALAWVGEVAAGFAAWRRLSPEESELLNLAVSPEWQGMGVASALLNWLVDEAKGDIFLEVAENNAPARALYRKHKWVQIDIRKGYYHGGNIDGIVMKKSSW